MKKYKPFNLLDPFSFFRIKLDINPSKFIFKLTKWRKKEDEDSILRKELFVLTTYIRAYTQRLMRQFENSSDDLERETLRKQIKDQIERAKIFDQIVKTLDEIISISDLLQDNSLTMEERDYFIQQREGLRKEKELLYIKDILRAGEFYLANPNLLPKQIKRPKNILDFLDSPKFRKICLIIVILASVIILSYLLYVNIRY